MKLAMPVSPYPTFPRKRGERSEGGGAGQTNRYASFTLSVLMASALLLSATSADAACADQSILYGQTVNGSLSTTDCTDFDATGATYYADYYLFTGTAGDKIYIQQSSSSIDPWLMLIFPSGGYTSNDDGGGGTTARIPATSGYYTLPESGTYLLEATSAISNTTGSYTLSLVKESSTATLPSAPTNVTATAGNGSATVTFTPGSIGSGTLVTYWAACGVDTTHLIKATGSSSPITVAGLTNGTAYYCWALTESTVGYSNNWSTVSNTVTPSATTSASASVVEFYNTTLDNYFMTADSGEASAIDNGSAGAGWIRTGNIFSTNGSTPVCRFYGSQSPGPNSHFYTADAGECAGLKQLQASTPATQKRWNYEGIAFNSATPANGTCPSGSVPVYRAYNNGSTRGVDSNHRITSNLTAIQQQAACGWSNEGVVMCATSGTSSGGTTSCGQTTLQKELTNFNTAIDGAVADIVNITKTVQNLETALQGDVNSTSQSAVIGTLVDEFESRATSLLANVVKMEQAESGIQQFTKKQASQLAVAPPVVGARARSLLANNWKTQAELEIQPFAEIRNRKPADFGIVTILGTALVIKGLYEFGKACKSASKTTSDGRNMKEAATDKINANPNDEKAWDDRIKGNELMRNGAGEVTKELGTKLISDVVTGPFKTVSTTAVVIKEAAGNLIQEGLKVISSTKECATDYKDPKCTIGVSTTDNQYPAIVPSGKTTVVVGGGNVSRTVIEEQDFPPGETVEITREEIPVTAATPEAITQNDAGVPVSGGSTPVVSTSLTLSKVVSSQDSTSITYTVSAALTGVTAPTSVSISVQNAGTGGSTKTISGDGTVSWSVTVLQKDATVTVTRQDTGEQQTLTLPGKTFDGYYTGTAITTFEAKDVFCWDSVSGIGISVSGGVLGGDVIGTLSGNVVSGSYTEYGLTFSGTINGTVMSGTWRDPEGGCSGTFSLSKQ